MSSDLLYGPRLELELGGGDDLAVAEVGAPVRRPSSSGVSHRAPGALPRARAAERARARPRTRPRSSTRSADRARDRAGELETTQPGLPRPVEADGERGAATGGQARPLRPSTPVRALRRACSARPGKPSSATRRFEPRPITATGCSRCSRPEEQLDELLARSPVAEPAGGTTGADRGNCESPTFSSFIGQPSRISRAGRSTSPAPIVSTRSPGRACRRRALRPPRATAPSRRACPAVPLRAARRAVSRSLPGKGSSRAA